MDRQSTVRHRATAAGMDGIHRDRTLSSDRSSLLVAAKSLGPDALVVLVRYRGRQPGGRRARWQRVSGHRMTSRRVHPSSPSAWNSACSQSTAMAPEHYVPKWRSFSLRETAVPLLGWVRVETPQPPRSP